MYIQCIYIYILFSLFCVHFFSIKKKNKNKNKKALEHIITNCVSDVVPYIPQIVEAVCVSMCYDPNIVDDGAETKAMETDDGFGGPDDDDDDDGFGGPSDDDDDGFGVDDSGDDADGLIFIFRVCMCVCGFPYFPSLVLFCSFLYHFVFFLKGSTTAKRISVNYLFYFIFSLSLSRSPFAITLCEFSIFFLMRLIYCWVNAHAHTHTAATNETKTIKKKNKRMMTMTVGKFDEVR